MRHYTEKIQPSKKIKVHSRTTCDLCDKEASRGDWASSAYEINETEIAVIVRHKDGESYPEGGSGTEYIVDLCPECFKDKLIPWLESQGCKAKREDWDWY